MKTKNQHGGPRPGAGRPKTKNPRLKIGARVLPETKKKIDSERGELSVGKFFDKLFSEWPVT